MRSLSVAASCHSFYFVAVQDGLYTYQGSDEPYVSGNNGRVKDNSFDNNVISNTDVATKIGDGDDNSFTSEFERPTYCLLK